MKLYTYNARLRGLGLFRFAANLSQANAPICLIDDDGETTRTQYQTADARHDEHSALKLALHACGRDYFAEPHDDRDDDAIVEDLCHGVAVRAVGDVSLAQEGGAP